jgi:hypothetical protein
MESHLRDEVSLSVSHITSTGNWSATERIATDFSPEHWEVLKTAVDHGYYERPRRVSVADLASILDEPRSRVQYGFRTAEDPIVSQSVEQTLHWGHRRQVVPYALVVFIVTVYRWFAGTGRRTTDNDLP